MPKRSSIAKRADSTGIPARSVPIRNGLAPTAAKKKRKPAPPHDVVDRSAEATSSFGSLQQVLETLVPTPALAPVHTASSGASTSQPPVPFAWEPAKDTIPPKSVTKTSRQAQTSVDQAAFEQSGYIRFHVGTGETLLTTNPRSAASYIDRQAQSVAYLFCPDEGFKVSSSAGDFFVGMSMVNFARSESTAASLIVYPSYAEAVAVVGPGQHAYFSFKGIVLPTMISPATAPATANAMRRAKVEFAEGMSAVFEMILVDIMTMGALKILGRISSKLLKNPKASEEIKNPSGKKATQREASVKTPYVNHNPKATPDEIKLGETLHEKAQAGDVNGIKSVEGAPESPVSKKPGIKSGRRGDYVFTLNDGQVVRADKYTPTSGRIENIADNAIKKGGQAEIVVIELGSGETAGFGALEARQIADHVLTTPDHSIKRIVIVKQGKILIQ